MPKVFESRVFLAQKGSESLKTTVPQSVATVLGLEAGARLFWTVSVGDRTATVRATADEASPAPPTGARNRSKRV